MKKPIPINEIFVATSTTSSPSFLKNQPSPISPVIPDNLSHGLPLSAKVIKPRPIIQSTYDAITKELKEENPDEKVLWIGRSSQIIHIGAYIICFLTGFLIFPLIIALIIYLQTKNTIYVVTQERLRVYSGIFTKRIDDLELYRVKDTVYIQPFIFRFFNLCSIQLYTSDMTWKQSAIQGIENGMALREQIRRIVESSRINKGVREIDYFTHPALPVQK